MLNRLIGAPKDGPLFVTWPHVSETLSMGADTHTHTRTHARTHTHTQTHELMWVKLGQWVQTRTDASTTSLHLTSPPNIHTSLTTILHIPAVISDWLNGWSITSPSDHLMLSSIFDAHIMNPADRDDNHTQFYQFKTREKARGKDIWNWGSNWLIGWLAGWLAD